MASSLPVLHRLVEEQLYEKGILSVKFRVLHGRVVYFRPFVRRRTASTVVSSQFVDRVIFVVAATGELVVADADAVPKRSVPLEHVTTILFDAATHTVALLFETNAAEHDIQLTFGPNPPGIGGGAEESSQMTGGKPDTSFTARLGNNTRVTFQDPNDSNNAYKSSLGLDSAAAAKQENTASLMTPKQFVATVLSFAPRAQVIHGPVSSVALKLAKPAHFMEPSPAAAFDTSSPVLPPQHVSMPPTSPTRSQPSGQGRHTEQDYPATPLADDAGGISPIPNDSQPVNAYSGLKAPAAAIPSESGLKFRDFLQAKDALDDGFERDFGTRLQLTDVQQQTVDSPIANVAHTTPSRPGPPPPQTTLPNNSNSNRTPSLRDIVAQGAFNSPTYRHKAPETHTADNDAHGEEDEEDADDRSGVAYRSTQQAPLPIVASGNHHNAYAPMSPPYDRVSSRTSDHSRSRHSHTLGGVVIPQGEEGLDTDLAVQRFSFLNLKATAWNTGTNIGVGGGGDEDNEDGQPPLLSEMVRKLRNRRGEVQMQNLMIEGEIKGLQRRIDAVLNSSRVINPLPELDDRPLHQPPPLPSTSRRGGGGGYRGNNAYVGGDAWDRDEDTYTDDFGDLGYDIDYDDDDEGPSGGGQRKLMSATKEYNRTLNLSLVVLNICRRQRQIHLHAEYDAHQRYRSKHDAMHRGSAGGAQHSILSSSGYPPPRPTPAYRSQSAASYGSVFMAPDAALMLRSHYGHGAVGQQMDMQSLVAMGF